MRFHFFQAVKGIVATVDWASYWLARLSNGAIVVAAVGFIVALMLQVTFRYVLNKPLSWSEELATFLFVWATLLSASVAVRKGRHLRLTFLEDLLPLRATFWTGLFCQCLIAAFGAFLVRDGWRLADLVWKNTSAAMGIEMGLLYISVPVTGALIFIHSVALIARALVDPAYRSPMEGDET